MSITLAPKGPLVLLYVGAIYATGRFVGALLAWIIDRCGIARILGISLSQKEMRDELEPKCGIAAGAFYLFFWIFMLLEVGQVS